MSQALQETQAREALTTALAAARERADRWPEAPRAKPAQRERKRERAVLSLGHRRWAAQVARPAAKQVAAAGLRPEAEIWARRA